MIYLWTINEQQRAMNTITTIETNYKQTMTDGLMVYRCGKTYFAIYHHGIGIRSTIYLVTNSERKAHNAIRRVLKYAPNEKIAVKA